MLERFAEGVEAMMVYLSRYMVGKDLAGYCELITAIALTDEDVAKNPSLSDPYTLVDDNGCLLTVFDLQGTYQILSAEDFDQLVDNLRVRLTSYLREPGHSMTISFERDPDRATDELMRLAEPQINAARRIGLKTEDVILDRVRRNAPLVAFEQNLLVVYTHPSVIGSDLDRERKEVAADAIKHKLPRIELGQSPAVMLMNLKFRHDTTIERIRADFESCGGAGRGGVLLKQLSAHEAVKAIRIMVNREGTSQKYRPVLPGDRFTPHGRDDKHDHSDLTPPTVNYQIVSENVETTRGSIIKTDELVHASLSMELGPQEPQPFSSLMSNLSKEIPWRLRIDLHPGGLKETRSRQMALSFVGMLGANSQIRDSFADLRERSKTDAILSMKITGSTWSTSERETQRRLAGLTKAMQAWGICQVTSVTGDPLASWAATIPGFTLKNPANRLLPPLKDALGMMPLQRPATPWSKGSLVVRTPEGKIYPIQLGSSLQDTWIEGVSAPPGSGKSVLLNTMNSATIHNPGSSRLPLMTIIDVGPSSSGLIRLIRNGLPEHRKDEALYLKLQNSPEFAVNPCDTQLGARYPTVREKEFLTDFFTLYCTDAASRVAPADCSRVLEKLIELSYEGRAGKSATRYAEYVEPRVDEVLRSSGLRESKDADWWEDATWWEVTDMLFSKGFVKEASWAQRQAVPVFTDFDAYLNDESVKQLYGEAVIPGGERLLTYMARCFAVASSKYAMFTGRTRYELSSETRVVAIDLNDVVGATTAEGSLKTAIMYMFARQLAAKNYFLREEVVLKVCPEMYHEYHSKRCADVQDEKKTIAYDEFHNTRGQEGFVQTCIKDAREGRKWGIRVVLVSQYLADFPQAILNAATAIYVMRGGNTADDDILRSIFKVSEEAIIRLGREARGPDPLLGGNFLALFKTKVGYIVQMLTNTVGPIELWAFSTTLEDASLRDRLYKSIGDYAARKILAERFPTGTAGATLEHMRAQVSDRDDESVVSQLASRLANEYLQKAALELGVSA